MPVPGWKVMVYSEGKVASLGSLLVKLTVPL